MWCFIKFPPIYYILVYFYWSFIEYIFYIILAISLYVTIKESVIKKAKSNICIFIYKSSFIGFLRIASINNRNIFPPSNGGNGNRFVTPSDSEISANM